MIILYDLKDSDLVHELFAPTSFNGLNSHIFNGLLFTAFVNDTILATTHLLINVVVVHIFFNVCKNLNDYNNSKIR